MKNHVMLLSFLTVCVLSGCGKSDSPKPTGQSTQSGATVPSNAQPNPAPAPTPTQSARFQVKGLYIGMNIQDVGPVLDNILKESALQGNVVSDLFTTDNNSCRYIIDPSDNDMIKGFVENGKINHSKGPYICKGVQPLTNPNTPPVVVIADAQGVVEKIIFTEEQVFNAKELSLSEFAQQFVNAYKIPEAKPNDDGSGYSYVSPDGTKVVIGNFQGGVAVILMRVANSEQLQNGFN